MTPLRLSLPTAFACSVILSLPASAQDETTHREGSVMFSVPAGFSHQFRTDIDSDSSFSVSRAAVGLGAQTQLTAGLDLSLRFQYSIEDYSFSGSGTFGEDPWDDIHTVDLGAIFTGALDSEWELFGGPIMQFSRESDADWGDSFIGGAVLGTRYEVSNDLTLGGGLGIISQVEDSARLFPVIIVNWQINDTLRLTSSTATSASGDSGLELVQDLANDWEVALGGGNRFHRFLLDDDDVAPDGVGQNEAIAIWGRVSYQPSSQLSLNLNAGVALDGELRLEDERGDRLDEEHYDAAPFIGISGHVRF